MPVTRNERSSAIHVSLPFRSMWPRWEGLPDAKDRAQAAFLYRGIIPTEHDVTSTDVLDLPVDYFMEGLPQYREQGRTYEGSLGRPREDVKVTSSGKRRLTVAKPSFKTRTDKRGYD